MKAILILAALAFCAACGGSSKADTPPPDASGSPASTATAKPSESAGDALKRQHDFESKGQWGREWDELAPVQQALVTRDQFAQCSARKPPVNFDAIDVTETYNDPITLDGVPSVAASAVTSTYRKGSQSQTLTQHEVLVDGQWRWVLLDSDAQTLHAGRCP